MLPAPSAARPPCRPPTDVLVEELGAADADAPRARGGHGGGHDVGLPAAGGPIEQDPGAQPQRRPRQQAGVAGYSVASWNAIAAPACTPADVVDRLNRAVREAVAVPAVRDKLGALGMRLQAGTPAELQALLASEIKRWGDVIIRAKIPLQ